MIVLHSQKVAGISGSEAHLLSLLPDLRNRGWDIRFLMLHEQEPGAWEFARELGLGGAVRFLGHVTPIQTAVEQSFAVVVPSLGEGFGMVALEAMERARPVIAAAIGGLEDLVRDGETGLLVPAGEAEPLAQAMLELASDPGRAAALGREARRRALERFPEDRCTERTEEVYRFWLNGRLHGAANGSGLPAVTRS